MPKQTEITKVKEEFEKSIEDMDYDGTSEMIFLEGFVRALEYVKGEREIKNPKLAWKEYSEQEGIA